MRIDDGELMLVLQPQQVRAHRRFFKLRGSPPWRTAIRAWSSLAPALVTKHIEMDLGLGGGAGAGFGSLAGMAGQRKSAPGGARCGSRG